MRGVVSLAAALALPQAMPGRDFILLTTFTVILVTVLGQGATLAPLIRWLQLPAFTQPGPSTMAEVEARVLLAKAQLKAVQDAARGPDGDLVHPRLLDQYEYRALAIQRYSDADGKLEGARNQHFGVVLRAIAAGRAELLRLHRRGSIHDQVLHTLERELDLEELTARRHRGDAFE